MPTAAPSAALLADLAAIVGPGDVLTDPGELVVYEADGSTMHDTLPGAVVFPTDVGQVSAIVRACVRHGAPFVARGAGTGLSGGAMALASTIAAEFNVTLTGVQPLRVRPRASPTGGLIPIIILVVVVIWLIHSGWGPPVFMPRHGRRRRSDHWGGGFGGGGFGGSGGGFGGGGAGGKW
jgi:hypothetical protein